MEWYFKTQNQIIVIKNTEDNAYTYFNSILNRLCSSMNTTPSSN